MEPHDARLAMARRLIDGYLERTGVAAGAAREQRGDPARRYLWTDAYAVMTLVDLHRATRDPADLERSARLVELVHDVLGRHRRPGGRGGWISGLPEDEGARHPTAGGLRIGKPLPERAAGEPFDERLEWDRDGQYFHYLVKWMLALDRLARVAVEPRWSQLAVELAVAAHRGFLAPREEGRPPRLHWKMSIDLARPLVASMGHHDPLDGLATAWRLLATREAFAASGAGLAEIVQDDRLMCEAVGRWTTRDPLGIGGLLSALAELVDLVASGHAPYDPLLIDVAGDAERSLALWSPERELGAPPATRLAFRELGLAIGLHAVPAMCAAVDAHPKRFGEPADRAIIRAHLEGARRRLELAARIERAWIVPAARACASWTAHEDINSVMLAASLVAGFMRDVRARAAAVSFPSSAR